MPPGGLVLDPFAGGSTRGLMAWLLGRRYVGVDLSRRQVRANEGQMQLVQDRAPEAVRAVVKATPAPSWIVGDSLRHDFSSGADFLFTCPPYGSLERYSKDPLDLCNMTVPAFLAAIRAIAARTCAALRQDRFACWVVGNYRDRGGMAAYNDLVGETVRAFEAAGLRLYNDCVLLNPVQSVAISGTRHFKATRKMGKVHQNVLVFLNGDPDKATAAVGPVSFGQPIPADTPVAPAKAS